MLNFISGWELGLMCLFYLIVAFGMLGCLFDSLRLNAKVSNLVQDSKSMELGVWRGLGKWARL